MVRLTRGSLLWLAPVASGALVGMCFPGGDFPWISAGWLMPVALVPLLVAIESLPTSAAPMSRARFAKASRVSGFSRARRAMALTWVFGAVLNSIAFFWTTSPSILFGGIPPAPAYALFALYCVLSAVFYPIVFFPFLWNAGRMAKKQMRPLPLIALALVSTALEHWVPRFFFWTFGSLTHFSAPLNQLAALGGFSTLTFFILLGNAWISRSVYSHPRSPGRVVVSLAGVAAMWGVLWGGGEFRIRSREADLKAAPHTRVAWVQPNFTFSELSSNPERDASAQTQSLDNLLTTSQEAVDSAKAKGDTPLDLVIWPESVAPQDFGWNRSQIERVQLFTKTNGVSVLAQAMEFEEDEVKKLGWRAATTYSTSFLIRPDGSQSAKFRKWVPIPFGESVPLEGWFPWLGDLVRDHVGNTGKVGIGTSYEALAYTPEFRVAPLICFDAISTLLPRLQVSKGGASILVNQANFAWMGRSNAGAEFRELARYRAIENARSLVLAANNGPSVAFDPLGRPITSSTPLMKRAVDSAALPVVAWTTPYSVVGDIPLAVLAILSGVILLVNSGRKERVVL